MDLESHVPTLKEIAHQTAYTGQFEKHWGANGRVIYSSWRVFWRHRDLRSFQEQRGWRAPFSPCTPPHATGINKDHLQEPAQNPYLVSNLLPTSPTLDPRLWWIPLARHSGLRAAIVYLSPENQCRSHWCHGSQPMHCAGPGSHQQLWLQVLQKPEAHLVTNANSIPMHLAHLHSPA